MAHIAMLALSYYPGDPRIRREAEALARAGDSVHIFCLRDVGEARLEHFGGITAHRVLRGANKESLAKYLWLSAKLLIAGFLALNRSFASKRFQLLHVHNMPDYLVFAGIVQKLWGVPVVLDLHDLMVELFASKWRGFKARMFLPIVRVVEKMSCGFADRLITTSAGFQQRLVARGERPEKITLILNSADERIFGNHAIRKFDRIERGARLLYHGTVAERFGLSVAVDAVARLQEMIPETVLEVFGKYDPAYRRQLEEQIERLGLTRRVILGGYRSLEEIREIICRSDIAVVPYLNDAFMSLALSTKTFEYVALGCPVVASRVASLQSIFDEHSIRYVEPGQPDALAERIAGLCLRPESRSSLVLHAARVYRPVSWAVMERRYLHLMHSLLSTAPSKKPLKQTLADLTD